MDDVTVARALHVLTVVLWIGGMGLVTTTFLPELRRMPDAAQRLAVFEAVKRRFGRQAKASSTPRMELEPFFRRASFYPE
jgi:uncharacterized membrane protein